MRWVLPLMILCFAMGGAPALATSASFDGPDLVVSSGKATFRLSGIADEHAFFTTVHAATRKGRDYYFVVGSSEFTRGWPPRGGNCGCGTEAFIRWLHVRDGKVIETQEGLYESCRSNRGGWDLGWKDGRLIWSASAWRRSADTSTPSAEIFLTWSYDPQHPERGIAEEEMPDPRSPVTKGPTNAQEAVATFQRLWRDSLSKQLEANPHFKLLSALYAEPGRVSATLQSSSFIHQRVSFSLTAEEKKHLILVGSLKDLEVERQIWAVVNPGGGPGFQAYLDARNGHLIFLWIIPEG